MERWMDSFFSPAKNWVLSDLLRGYGLIVYNCLKGIKVYGELTKDSLYAEEVRTKQPHSLEEVETIIGYSFNSRRLLNQAFTHPSYDKGCASYKQLEYVGDSVLNLLVTKEQYCRYPDLPTGLLTPLRAANVDTEKLARAAVQHKFHNYIRHGHPVLEQQIQTFIDALPEHPLHSHGLLGAPKLLADVVESTIGAVFIDSNYSIDTTWEVAKGLLDPMITLEMLQRNPLRKLHEMCQKHKLKLRLVDRWSTEGTFEVFVNHKLRGRGKCNKKKDVALNRAANDAYNEVVRIMGLKNSEESEQQPFKV